ncbi:ABC transporter family substrate-binding protein [Rothia nasimurium]|uniref:ABC transporter family substrate-binding protein n=1 Tax=Rothia nasimurium TaxID=85336 RepID=UPI001F2F3B44|nr:ABC transporter family substrate-binding protein [Rothia nasimurium]
MSSRMNLNRRSFFLVTGLAGATGLLAACGGGTAGTSSAASASAVAAGGDISQLVAINEQDRTTLQAGGTLTLAVPTLGPNFNVATATGYTTSNLNVMAAVNTATVSGLWRTNALGEYSVNPDYCTAYEASLTDGVQTISIKLNPNAKFNDGTPIDIKALQVTHKTLTTEGYDIVDSGAYVHIASIEEDGDPFSVKVTMSEPYFPIEGLFGTGLVHPAMEDAAIFNEGLLDTINNDYLSGPYKVENWDSAQKVLTVVPNENWWGVKPLLERITFRQMETSAARAAFRNGEIDAVSASTLTAYNDVSGVADTEPRRGQNLYAGGLMINPERLTDTALRRAIFAAVDRQGIAAVRFNGLNWTESLPGSMMLMPFATDYQDNYPTETGAEVAKKILTDAGYTQNGDYMESSTGKAKFAVTTFGDDSVAAATAQTLVQQMKAAGIECTIDNQPDANYSTVIGNKEYDVTVSGYGILGEDASGAAEYFYHSSTYNGIGTPEIDEMVDRLRTIESMEERNALSNEIEKKHMAEVATMAPIFNGPEIVFCKTKLANYGAFLFARPYANPDVYINVGWMKS